jgi:hypothetical protein
MDSPEGIRVKRSLPSRGRGGGGQYKIYNSLNFINFISLSRKVKPKMLTCV